MLQSKLGLGHLGFPCCWVHRVLVADFSALLAHRVLGEWLIGYTGAHGCEDPPDQSPEGSQLCHPSNCDLCHPGTSALSEACGTSVDPVQPESGLRVETMASHPTHVMPWPGSFLFFKKALCYF